MKLVFFARARRDLEEILDYIAQDNPLATEKTVLRIQEKVNVLLEFPEIGRPALPQGVREFVVPTMPYTIPYRVKGDEIQILRVYHTARAPLPSTSPLH